MGLFDIIKRLFNWLFRIDSDGRTTERENKEYDEEGYKRLKTIKKIKEDITNEIKDPDNKNVTKAIFELLELTQQNNSSNKTILNQIIMNITRNAILEYAPTNDDLKELTKYEPPIELDKEMNELKNEKNNDKIKDELNKSTTIIDSVTEKKKDHLEKQIKLLDEIETKSNMAKTNAGKIGEHIKFIKNRKTIALNKTRDELKTIKELTKENKISKLMDLITIIQDELINEFEIVKSTNYLIDLFTNSLTALGSQELTNEVVLNSNELNKEKRELLTKEYDTLNKIIDQIQDKTEIIEQLNKKTQETKIGTDQEKLDKEKKEIEKQKKESEEKEQKLKEQTRKNDETIPRPGATNTGATNPDLLNPSKGGKIIGK